LFFEIAKWQGSISPLPDCSEYLNKKGGIPPLSSFFTLHGTLALKVA
jgi:hypothetical protein